MEVVAAAVSEVIQDLQGLAAVAVTVVFPAEPHRAPIKVHSAQLAELVHLEETEVAGVQEE
jgi:hypothetical protein